MTPFADWPALAFAPWSNVRCALEGRAPGRLVLVQRRDHGPFCRARWRRLGPHRWTCACPPQPALVHVMGPDRASANPIHHRGAHCGPGLSAFGYGVEPCARTLTALLTHQRGVTVSHVTRWHATACGRAWGGRCRCHRRLRISHLQEGMS